MELNYGELPNFTLLYGLLSWMRTLSVTLTLCHAISKEQAKYENSSRQILGLRSQIPRSPDPRNQIWDLAWDALITLLGSLVRRIFVITITMHDKSYDAEYLVASLSSLLAWVSLFTLYRT